MRRILFLIAAIVAIYGHSYSQCTPPATPSFTINGLSTTTVQVCEGSTVNFSTAAVAGATYIWSGPNGWNPGNVQSPSIPNVALNMAGTYSLAIVVAGCTSSVFNRTLAVNLAATADVGPPINVCQGTTINLFEQTSVGGSAVSGSWTAPSGSGTNTSNYQATTYTPSITNGTVILTFTTNDPAGPCPSAVRTLPITVTPFATVNAGTSQNICYSGGGVNLNGIIGGSAINPTWSSASGSFSNNNILNPVYTPVINSGTVTLTLSVSSSGPCPSVSSNTTLTLFEPVILQQGPVPAVCTGSVLQLSNAINMSGGGVGGSFSATSGTGTNVNDYQNATYTPTATPGSAVTLTFTASDPPGPCLGASLSIPLTILAPITANAGTPQTICQGIPIQLNGSMNSSASLATWSGPSGSFTNNPGLTPQYTAAVPGNVTLTMVASNPNAACNSATSNVTMTVNPAATVDAGAATSMCGGSSINLNGVIGGGATSATWSSPNGTFGNPSSLTSTFTPTIATGTATLTLTTNDPPGPCPAVSDNVTVDVIIAPTANAGNNASICEGETVNLNGSLGGIATIGTWSAPSGTFSNVNDLNAVYTPAITSGSVILTLSPDQPPGPCPSSSSNITISVNLEPTANAGSPITVCEGESVVLSGVIGGGATSGTWSAPSGTFSDVNNLNATYTPDITSGSVTLTLTSNDPSGSCGVAISTVQVTVNPAPTVDAGIPQTVCEGGSVTLAGIIGGGATSATWSAPSGTFGNASSLTSSYSPAISNGVVTLTLTTDDPAGPCNAVTSTVDITVDLAPTVNAGAPQTVCEGGSVTLAGVIGGSAASATWSAPSGTFGNSSSLTSS
ncbi:MAG: hypothetical protein MH137_13810, partial [Flavobacteriales bacterium]|nr:hypothetical protein [Flavobacteriales bacterium]